MVVRKSGGSNWKLDSVVEIPWPLRGWRCIYGRHSPHESKMYDLPTLLLGNSIIRRCFFLPSQLYVAHDLEWIVEPLPLNHKHPIYTPDERPIAISPIHSTVLH